MSFCKRKMSPLQRRALGQLGGTMGLTVAITVFSHFAFEHGRPALPIGYLLAALSVAPIIIAISVAARYLAAEPDEFIRMLVVRSLLWGLGATMAADAVIGFLTEYHAGRVPLSLLNADLLFVSTALAFRLLQRSYR